MGRELKRKEAKKNKKQNNKKNVELDTKINLITLLKLVFFIILLLLVIYYILAVFVTKEIDISNKNSTSTQEETNNTNTSVSDKILASNIFNQKEEIYYVYFYDFGTDEENDLTNLISNGIEDKLYKVDTSSGLNSKYVTKENGNKKATKIDELKVKSNTLIKIDNDKITEYHEGKNDIMSSIKE